MRVASKEFGNTVVVEVGKQTELSIQRLQKPTKKILPMVAIALATSVFQLTLGAGANAGTFFPGAFEELPDGGIRDDQVLDGNNDGLADEVFRGENGRAFTVYTVLVDPSGDEEFRADGPIVGVDRFGNCFSNITNSTDASAPSTAFSGATLASSEASTSQSLELIARRRHQKTQTCPTGLALVNGQCIPEQRQASLSTLPSGGASSGGTGGSGAPQSSGGSSASAPSQSINDDEQYDSSDEGYGVWIEGGYEYEERDNIPNGNDGSSFDRETRNWQVLGGIDKSVKIDNSAIALFGLLGGYSETEQDYDGLSSNDSTETVFTSFDIQREANPNQNNRLPIGIPGTGIDGAIESKKIVLPVIHAKSARTIAQTIDGVSVGGYGSYYNDGFSLDLFFKSDIQELERVSVLQDTAPNRVNREFLLTANNSGNSVPNRGCILLDGSNVNAGDDNFILTLGDTRIREIAADNLEGEQTVSRRRTQSTDLETYTLAVNAQYRYDYPEDGFWIEPTVGVRYTFADFDDSSASLLGLEDGFVFRVQGGIRAGMTQLVDNGSSPFVWTGSVGVILYSDVVIRGFTDTGNGLSPAAVEDDEGELRVQLTSRNEFNFLNGTIFYIESTSRLGEDLWSIGGKGGIRITW